MDEFSSDQIPEGLRPWSGPIVWLVAFLIVASIPSPNAFYGKSAAGLFVAIVGCGGMVHASIVLIYWAGRWGARQLTFQLDETGITSLRPSHPSNRIAYSQIERIIEQGYWLEIIPKIGAQRMLVPRAVNDYDQLRSLLIQHHDISTRRPKITRKLLFAVARLGATAAAWAVYLLARNRQLEFASAAIIFIVLGWISPAYWKLCSRGSRWRAAVGLGAVWGAAVYLIVTHGRFS